MPISRDVSGCRVPRRQLSRWRSASPLSVCLVPALYLIGRLAKGEGLVSPIFPSFPRKKQRKRSHPRLRQPLRLHALGNKFDRLANVLHETHREAYQ